MNAKVFTKEQRHEIYKRAYKYFSMGYAVAMCRCMRFALQDLHPEIYEELGIKTITNLSVLVEMLPEFLAIKPENAHINSFWWVDRKIPYEPITAYTDCYIFMRKCMFETIIERTKTIQK